MARDIRAIFAVNLRSLREKRGLSQEQLARRARIDRTYVSALERGIYSATITMVARLAKVLQATPAWMVSEGAKARRGRR
ncbi:MAG TPA: helix-turn-helix transcriptional regulator [Rhizomicrobium sp.]|nr:helix-turn-helix transcriptional regulator [Rhizomicrobium sp.]